MSRRRGTRAALALAFLLVGATATAAGRPAAPRLADLDAAALAARQQADLDAAGLYRAGLARAVAFARSRPDLFPGSAPAAPRLLAAEARDAVRAAWKSVLDYTLALESIESFHEGFALLGDAQARARSFHAAHAAHLAAYRHALEFVDLAAADPKLSVVLNDPVDDLGLPAGAYDRYKLAYLNVAAATRFAAYALAGQAFGEAADQRRAAEAREDAARILAAGRGRGEALTAANALEVLRRAGARAVFPVQAGVSAWMGDTKVARRGRSLISPAQVEALRARMRPGDVMLQRREWYLSNVGLPGFWSHAALYVGTPEERRAFFDDDEVRRWVASRGERSGDLERLLERAFPASRAAALLAPEGGHAQRVIEAISEGVVFTTLEHSADADSLVVLRPRLPRAALAAALERAWSYAGRPYDFDFDFQTDAALVCTELVYKAFEPSAATPGLRLRLEEILGRTAVPANAIARQFDEQFGTAEAQLDFVTFLDGQEKTGVAVEAGLEPFRSSWRRPKWHVVVQEPPGGGGAADVAVTVHHAYGTRQAFVVEGRVAERRDGKEYHPGDGWFANLRRSLGSLHADELEGAALRVRFGGAVWELRADDEGSFALRAGTPAGVPAGWQPLQVEVVGARAGAAGELLVVPEGEVLGIISDVDDTVLVSEVGDRSRLLAHTLLENPLQRRAVPGAAERYRAILARNARPEAAPVVYLTGSPRQLVPAIRAFLEHNGFPAGPIVAKKVTDGAGRDPLFDQERYKLARIEGLLEDLPGVRFVLFGDDGERDPEVYRAVRERHPGRVEAVYIRRVSADPARVAYEGQLATP